ncbi:MAG: hypothetical protein ACI92E_003238, partial [Oceanicoccus sp.]
MNNITEAMFQSMTLTPASLKLAMRLWRSQAVRIIGTARAAPLPSPKR